jgi:8-oxo-dGTP diphosphatase
MSAASHVLGDRVHPVTGRRVIYVACDLISGTPRVADEDEIAEVAWCDIGQVRRLCRLQASLPPCRHTWTLC